MTITPDQARELLDMATPGPWEALFDNEAIETDTLTVLCNTDGAVEWGRNIEHDVPLAAAAPDLAQTVIDQAKRIEELEAQLAGAQWEYGVEHLGHVSRWGSRESTEDDLSYYLRIGSFIPRLVRRLVGPVVVIDGE